MRNRLIEIIKQCTCHYSPPCDGDCGLCKNVEIYDEQIEYIADHLLANSVIVPPCKIGDTVYAIHLSNLEDVVEGEVLRYVFNIHNDFRVDVAYNNGFTWLHNPHDFGKFVFLTREEAEKARKKNEIT